MWPTRSGRSDEHLVELCEHLWMQPDLVDGLIERCAGRDRRARRRSIRNSGVSSIERRPGRVELGCEKRPRMRRSVRVVDVE